MAKIPPEIPRSESPKQIFVVLKKLFEWLTHNSNDYGHAEGDMENPQENQEELGFCCPAARLYITFNGNQSLKNVSLKN